MFLIDADLTGQECITPDHKPFITDIPHDFPLLWPTVAHFRKLTLPPRRRITICAAIASGILLTVLAAVTVTLFSPKAGDDVDSSVVVQMIKANSLLDNKGFDLAVSAYTDIIEKHPLSVEAYTRRGVAYFHLGENSKCIDDLNRADEILGNSSPAENAYFKGVCLRRMGRFREAIIELSEVVGREPSIDASLFERGRCYLEIGLPEKAVVDFSKYLSLNPGFDVGYLFRARAYFDLEEYTASLADLHRYESINGEDAASRKLRSALAEVDDEARE